MKRVMVFLSFLVILALIFTMGPAFAQQDAKAQLKIALQENAKLKAQLESWETAYRKEVIKNAVLNGQAQGTNTKINKATGILQKGYENGKLNYQELWDVGFRLSLDSTNAYQRPSKSKNKKDKK